MRKTVLVACHAVLALLLNSSELCQGLEVVLRRSFDPAKPPLGFAGSCPLGDETRSFVLDSGVALSLTAVMLCFTPGSMPTDCLGGSPSSLGSCRYTSDTTILRGFSVILIAFGCSSARRSAT